MTVQITVQIYHVCGGVRYSCVQPSAPMVCTLVHAEKTNNFAPKTRFRFVGPGGRYLLAGSFWYILRGILVLVLIHAPYILVHSGGRVHFWGFPDTFFLGGWPVYNLVECGCWSAETISFLPAWGLQDGRGYVACLIRSSNPAHTPNTHPIHH